MELMERRRILLNTPHINIVTGLQFVTDMVAPIESLVISFSPIQDLHGYDSPWPAGGGANIWDEEWEQGRIANGANVSNAAGFRSKNKIKINPNTTYYLHVGSADYGNFWVSYYDEDEVYIPSTNPSGNAVLTKNSEFTTLENAHYMRFFLSTATEYINDISINYPSTSTGYYPYSNICPISGWTGATIKRTGANLWGGSVLKARLLEIGGTDYGDNIGVSAGVLNNKILFDTIFKENTQYTLILDVRKPSGNTNTNVRIYYTDGNYSNIFLSGDVTERQTVVVNSTSGKTIEKIGGINSSAGTYFYFDTCGLFEGVLTAEDFEPYEGETYTADWTSEAGTVYGGSLDVTTGLLTVDRKLYTVNAISTIAASYIKSDGVDGYILNREIYPSGTPANMPSDLVADKLKYLQENFWNRVGNTNCFTLNYDQLHIKISNGLLGITDYTEETVSTAKVKLNAWLAENPVTVAIPVAPVTYQLTAQQIRTVKGANNLSSNSNGEVTVNYWTHLD